MAASSQDALIRVSGLSAGYPGRAVFDGVDLDILGGQFVGLLGPNGAGKTTLLRAMLGLIPGARGTVRVAGRSGVQVRKAVGYVPQRHDVAWDFPIDVASAVLNATLDLRPWYTRAGAAERDAVADALDSVNLTELSARPIADLSGGQRQRVLVARALVRKPRALFLDEPFTGLDIPSTEQLLALFRELAGHGIAIVMSTHNIVEAVDSCDRLILFRGGVVADAAPGQLCDTQPWMDTFGVGPESPWLAALQTHVQRAQPHQPHRAEEATHA